MTDQPEPAGVAVAKQMTIDEARALIERAVENPTFPVAAHDLVMAVATVLVRNGMLFPPATEA